MIDHAPRLEPDGNALFVQTLYLQRSSLTVAAYMAIVKTDGPDQIVRIEKPDQGQAGVTE